LKHVADWPQKLDHIGIGVTDLAASSHFYQHALQPIGISQIGASQTHAAFGIGPMPYLTIRLVDTAGAAVHVALTADSRAAIDAFYAAGLAAGGRDNGAPGLRPDYHSNYYAAFLLDPDGHNIELVKHSPE